MTDKQHNLLKSLINRHPNFRREVGQDGVAGVGSEAQYFQLSNQPYPNDKNYLGFVDVVQAQWLNKKYFQWLPEELQTTTDLDTETASALITRLQLGEQERQERNT